MFSLLIQKEIRRLQVQDSNIKILSSSISDSIEEKLGFDSDVISRLNAHVQLCSSELSGIVDVIPGIGDYISKLSKDLRRTTTMLVRATISQIQS